MHTAPHIHYYRLLNAKDNGERGNRKIVPVNREQKRRHQVPSTYQADFFGLPLRRGDKYRRNFITARASCKCQSQEGKILDRSTASKNSQEMSTAQTRTRRVRCKQRNCYQKGRLGEKDVNKETVTRKED